MLLPVTQADRGIMIKIDGYLLQSKLEAALEQMVGEQHWLGRELSK